MEPKGKTSFIPKKPVVDKDQGSSSTVQSLLFIVTFIIFILSLVGAGGVYFYKNYLEDQITKKKQYLEESKEAFEPSLIQELKTLDDRMQASQALLNSHIAPSVIFSALEKDTLKTVRFNDAKYSYNDGKPTLKMQGEALSFNSIALQSDIFGENDLFVNPVFSSLSVNKNGNIGFAFSSALEKGDILYKQNLSKGESQQDPNSEGGSGGEESATSSDDLFME